MNKIYKKMMNPNKKISYAQSKSIFLYSLLILAYTENRALYLIYLSYIILLLISYIMFQDLCMGSVLVSQQSISSLVPEDTTYFNLESFCSVFSLLGKRIVKVSSVHPAHLRRAPFDSGARDDGDGWEVFFCATGVLEGSSCCGNFVTCYGIWLCCSDREVSACGEAKLFKTCFEMCLLPAGVFRSIIVNYVPRYARLLIYMYFFAVYREAGLLIYMFIFVVSLETGLLMHMYPLAVFREARLLVYMYSFAVPPEAGLLLYMSLFAVSREARLLVCIYSFAVSRETGLLIYMYFSSVFCGAGLLKYYHYFDVFHG